MDFVTTADPSELEAGGFEAVAKELVDWVNRKHSPCSLGLFMDLDGARSLLASRDKMAAFRDLAGEDRLIAEPLPEPLVASLPGRGSRRRGRP